MNFILAATTQPKEINMSAGFWFWLILVLSVLFGYLGYYGPADHQGKAKFGVGLIVLVLIALLGYRVFGSPIQ